MNQPSQPPFETSAKLFDLCPSRRTLIAAITGVATVSVIAACGDSATSTSPASPESGDLSTSGNSESGARVPVDQVPVGSAIVVAATMPYVVAQPTEGKFVAFNAACTHQGTTVAATDGLELRCPAHGSEFDGGTGAVTSGPASKPLESAPIRQQGDVLVVG